MAPPLSGYDVAFCDSLEGLRQAYDAGLPTSASILSISPALVRADRRNIIAIERRLPAASADAFQASLGAFTRDIYNSVHANSAVTGLALTAARAALAVQPLMLKSGMLRSEDFLEPRAILQAVSDQPNFNRHLRLPWGLLLARSRLAVSFEFRVAPAIERAVTGDNRGSISERLSLGGWNKTLYRALCAIWRFVPISLSRGEVLIRTENELIKDTAVSLGLRGFALRALPPPAINAEVDHEAADALCQIVGPMLRARTTSIAPAEASAPIELAFRQTLQQALLWHAAGRGLWTKALGARPRAILVNYPFDGIDETLAAAAAERAIPMATFQHGVGGEIGAHYSALYCQYENVVGDLYVVYNEAAARFAEANPFKGASSRPVVAGMPTELTAIGSKSANPRGRAPLLFVSTALYRGNVQKRFDRTTDIDLAEFEVSLIEKVLARVPHRVDYKPYPAVRYSDLDPVVHAVHGQSNLRVVDEIIDLRYMIDRYRVLIVARATSTVSWCMLTGRPVVYINTNDFYALRPEVARAFRDGTFFFDSAEAGWLDRLRDFLAQPVEAIELAWRAKAEGRRQLLRDYFTAATGRAGARAARAILARMQALRPTRASVAAGG